MAIGLCLLGLAVIPNIPADILPDFKKPVVVSFFSYPGLPTGEMEKFGTDRVFSWNKTESTVVYK